MPLQEEGAVGAQPLLPLCAAPPLGVSAAEVGYIVDSCADDRDLFALVYEFAQQGLLTIEAKGSEDRPEVVLHKKADIPQTAPDYQRTFFQALFGKKQEFSFAHAGVPSWISDRIFFIAFLVSSVMILGPVM